MVENREIKWTKNAQTDLAFIRTYSLMKFDYDITSDIVDKTAILLSFPNLGQATHLSSESRFLVIENWNIYYVIRKEYILIQRILSHQQQD